MRGKSAGSARRLGLTSGVYGKSTAALLSEIGRRITKTTEKNRETLWLKQRGGLAVQRGNALSRLTAVRENTTSSWGQLTACSMHLVAVVIHHHWCLVGVVIRAVCHNLSFKLNT